MIEVRHNEAVDSERNLLGWGIVFLDRTVDESGDVASSSARLISGLGDGQLAKELIEHFDRLLILGLGVGRVRGDRLHNIDGRHVDDGEITVD